MTQNLVLVTLDSLRADHCQPDDLGRAIAPTFRRMAREGVEYEYAIAPGPRTPASMPALFTGEYVPPVVPGPGDFWERRRSVIRQHMNRHRSLPARLQQLGYHTVGVTVNPWTQNTGFDRGFDEFIHVNSGTLEKFGPPVFRFADTILSGTTVGERLYWFNKREWFIRWTDFYDTVLEVLRTAPEPYFLWVFLLDTHQPYIVPRQDREESSAPGMYYASFRELASEREIPSWVETRLRRAYRDSIRSVDRFLAHLLDDTAEDDPAIVVHSDHGEAFGEHGTYGHEQRLYEENIHVPFVLHNVGLTERISDPLPTLRLPQLTEALVAPTGFDPERFCEEFAIASVDDGHIDALTTRNWKLIDGETDEELYNLEIDPGEGNNLLPERSTEAGHLRGMLKSHRNHRAEQARIGRAVAGGIANG